MLLSVKTDNLAGLFHIKFQIDHEYCMKRNKKHYFCTKNTLFKSKTLIQITNRQHSTHSHV